MIFWICCILLSGSSLSIITCERRLGWSNIFFDKSIDYCFNFLFLDYPFACLKGVIGVFSDVAIVLWSFD